MDNKKTIVGGTFDKLHSGHKRLLEEAFKFGPLVVGLTSDKMAKERKGEGVSPYKERESSLLLFAEEMGVNLIVREIDDPVGFSLEDGFSRIVASEETRDGVSLINRKRALLGKEPLNLIEIKLLLAEDGQPISSTRIRRGEIDQEGKLL